MLKDSIFLVPAERCTPVDFHILTEERFLMWEYIEKGKRYSETVRPCDPCPLRAPRAEPKKPN